MNWKEISMTLFGTTQWLGLNIGFWVAMAAVLLIVILMNVIFWGIKPRQSKSLISSRGHCTRIRIEMLIAARQHEKRLTALQGGWQSVM